MARLGLYQPFIEDRNVRRLYRLKIHYLNRGGRKVPMTILVNRVLDDFFEAQEREDAPSLVRNTDPSNDGAHLEGIDVQRTRSKSI